MGKRIEWKSGWTQFLGRNGFFRSTGFEFKRILSNDRGWSEDVVRIQPITTRGLLARCFIEVPTKELKRFVKTLEAESKSRRRK